jgi:hypothetical protein
MIGGPHQNGETSFRYGIDSNSTIPAPRFAIKRE